MDSCWTYRQNERQQVDHEVDKMDTSYTQSNAWPTEDEMTWYIPNTMGNTSSRQKIRRQLRKAYVQQPNRKPNSPKAEEEGVWMNSIIGFIQSMCHLVVLYRNYIVCQVGWVVEDDKLKVYMAVGVVSNPTSEKYFFSSYFNSP